ncbi:hydrolase 1, exosortase A system-associated, partial [Sphingomonas bacterium]|uniref:hydrolase 1, exosortase A system-associated n=1 Tax=Sphingomonas bacterium TaxID=1895847 RepID=UPI001576FE70
YASSAADIAAAAAALRREQPQVVRLVGFGNCDAASALALFGRTAGIDAVMLANPWVVETDELPPAAAIRHRYATRLRDPGAWWRLATGRVDLAKLFKGLRRLATPEPQQLADRIVAAISGWGEDARVVLAQGDATAIAFAKVAAARDLPTRTEHIATASHSFARPGDAAALETAIRRALTPPLS